jgi:hypothetical protein
MTTRLELERESQLMPIVARQAAVATPGAAKATVPASGASRSQARNGREVQPFDSAEQAWLWTMAALTARRDGARYSANKGRVGRPCDPDDVVRCLDGLYRQRRIDLAHARILRIWGERQMAPSLAVAVERQDHRLWVEALGRLEWPLRVKGIVG